MPQSFIALHCHIVFSTKERCCMICPEWADRVYQYIGGILRAHDCCLMAAGGMPDQVHLLLSLGKTRSIAEIIRIVKSNSSSWISDTFPLPGRFAWQTGYGVFSVSRSQMDRVREYISTQESHHRAETFQEEFLRLLERHGIEYDDRYLWD